MFSPSKWYQNIVTELIITAGNQALPKYHSSHRNTYSTLLAHVQIDWISVYLIGTPFVKKIDAML